MGERGQEFSGIGETFNWDYNPFTFRIIPGTFVGYSDELHEIESALKNGDKFALLMGPTGSGKTTLLKNIASRFHNNEIVYLPKPPKNPEDWVKLLRPYTEGPIRKLLRLHNGLDLYSISSKLNSKLSDRRIMIFIDECHEASQESLEWIRTITDHVDRLSIVMAGLPIFENNLKDNLESFLRRITIKVDLGCLDQSETKEFIKRKIESAGGKELKPFTDEAIEAIYQKTGGFPREILRVCNDLVRQAAEKDISVIDSVLLKETESYFKAAKETLDYLPPRQKLIIDTLASEGDLTPTELVENIQTKGVYKDQDNAIRSVNNLLRRLMTDGLVERKKFGKAYKYRISPRYQSYFVKA